MSEQIDATGSELDYTSLAADLVSAYVSNNSVPVTELPSLIMGVHGALIGLRGTAPVEEEQVEKPTPAQIRKSITPDAIISFLDGKPYKTLRRHLTTRGNMTPEAYRAKFGLPHDYPMVCENYAKQRSQLARDLGLGKLGGRARVEASEPEPQKTQASKTPRGRGGRKKSDATAAAA